MNFTVINGDVIRAYDFKPMIGRPDAFIEGRVVDCHNTEMGYQAYKILVTKDHWGEEVTTEPGHGSRVGVEFFVPWRTDFSEFQGRVINLSR